MEYDMTVFEIDGLDEIEIENTSVEEIDSENINLIFLGIDKSGSMSVFQQDMKHSLTEFQHALASAKEADEILSNLRKHTNAKEEHNVLAADKGNQTLLKVITSQTINGKYTFTIQLNLTSYADGDLYYNGYNAECSSSLMKWYVKGFSLASDNSEGNFIFQSESYIYMKVADNGIKYMQIPVSIQGTYNPKNHDASFTYKL